MQDNKGRVSVMRANWFTSRAARSAISRRGGTKMRDEFLNGEIFYSLQEVRVLTECWRVYFNTERPHSLLGYRPPAPVAWQNEAPRGMEKWKANNGSHFPTPPTTATGRYLPLPLRYINSLTGTNYRAGQSRFPSG